MNSVALLPYAIMIGGIILFVAPSFFLPDRRDERR
jgi:hypothetical protein